MMFTRVELQKIADRPRQKSGTLHGTNAALARQCLAMMDVVEAARMPCGDVYLADALDRLDAAKGNTE